MITFLILAEIKHYICDFLFQNKYMLGKFKDYPDFIAPLLTHAFVSAVGISLIVILFNIHLAFIIFLLELTSHFIIDRLKASKKLLGRWKADSKYFWWALGFDQMLHHLMILIYALILFV